MEVRNPKPTDHRGLDIHLVQNSSRDFPGGPLVKNLPCSAGDTDLIPGPGSCHVPRGN